MDNLKKILEVLNDLIRINKEREAGYSKMSRELTPAEHNLRSAFERKARESRNNIAQLQAKADDMIRNDHEERTLTETSTYANLTGRIYKMWTGVKDFFSGSDRSSILKNCAEGEERIRNCYEDAINDADVPDDIREMLRQQLSGFDAAQREIRNYLENDQNVR